MAENLGNIVNNWRVRNKSTVTATENGRVRIKVECFINSANGYWFSGLNVHGGAAVNGQWNTADQTNVSIAQNSGVGLVSKEIWVNRTKATQSVLCTAEARVSGFAAGTSRSDLRISVPPLPSYTVSYNANGGSGAPGSQTKWWGEFLTLSNTRPTRANHMFLGWATSANGAVAYQPGGRYGADNNNTLYAKWKLNTKPPTIQSFTAQRVDEDGNMVESGTRVKLYVTWKCDTTGDSANTVQSVTIAVQDGGTWKETPVTASGATGTGTITLTDLSADSSWRFRATVKDKYGTVSAYTTVGPQRFLLDFSAGGRGIGIGVGAPAEGVAINGSPVTVNGCRMPRIYAASKTIIPSSSSNRHTLFTAEEWASITGTDIAEGHPTVLVSNGDVNALNVAVTGAGYEGSTKQWYVWLASSISGIFRVNYTIII
ncbi:MAG: InlB B-repeat-containing protein [Bifidobacterium sp.]|nr:InlB B-repeat-containing protein [Bifidobacterium sp.]